MSAADRLLNQGPELPGMPAVVPKVDHSQLIRDIENAVYAQHQTLLKDLDERFKAIESKMSDGWIEELREKMRTLAVNTSNGVLKAAQDSAVNIIGATKDDMLMEMRKVLDARGFSAPEMLPESSPQILNNGSHRTRWVLFAIAFIALVGLAIIAFRMIPH